MLKSQKLKNVNYIIGLWVVNKCIYDKYSTVNTQKSWLWKNKNSLCYRLKEYLSYIQKIMNIYFNKL